MKIVTDASTDLPLEYKELVEIIPMYIIKDSKKIKVDKNFDYEEFYIRMKEDWLKGKLRTSQPSIKDVLDTLKKIDDKDILVITVSSKLSGTYNTCRNASRFLKDKDIYVYDSKSASIGTGLMIKVLIDKIKNKDISIDDVLSILKNIKVGLYFSVDIDFLYRSGRINRLKYEFLKFLRGNPILKVEKTIKFHSISYNPIEKFKKLIRNKKEFLWASDLEKFDTIPEPKVLGNPIITINTGPGVGVSFLQEYF